MTAGRTCYFVYILSSLSGTLYVGLTDNLVQRLSQHASGAFDGFTKKYGVHRLMYFEVLTDPMAAAQRERQIKKYSREKKIALFKNSNPEWKDLSDEVLELSKGASLGEGFLASLGIYFVSSEAREPYPRSNRLMWAASRSRLAQF